MNIQETILVGVVSSVIASLVFYLWMILIKPRFDLSAKICLSKVDDDYMDYMIKVVNTTRSFITNVNYSLVYCKEGKDGIKEIQTVEPYKIPITNMNKYTDKNTDYATRITYRLKRDEYPLKEDTYFMFTSQAYHSFSNAMRIKSVIYKEDDVQEGIFETGRSTKILIRR